MLHAPPLLSVSAISKDFGDGTPPILSEVNFNLHEGHIISILGPSGSGKSTLLHIMGLLDTATSGQIVFDGVNCSQISEARRTEVRLTSIGFIYQFHHLLPEFSALENLVIPQLVNNITRQIAEEEAAQHMQLVGLAHKIHSMPSDLSGGEKQRVAIARAFINHPKVVLADEPTGNLDQDNANKVLDLFINEAKERNLAAVIVTHNIDLAKKTDHILVLDRGRLQNYSARN